MFRTILLTLKHTFRKYVQYSSINGFKLLHFVWHNKTLRNVWLLFMLLQVINIVLHLHELYIQLTVYPLTLATPGTQFPITEFYFPAVGVCSVNKISRRSVLKFAEILCKKSPKYCEANPNFWLDKMKYLRGYYDERAIVHDSSLQFQILLEQLLADDTTNSCEEPDLDVTTLLKKLAPTCEDLLIACMWLDREVNCTEIFSITVTSSGFCCVFNNNFYNQSLNRVVAGSGIKNGLTLLLNMSTSDYFFKPHIWNGMLLHIFNPVPVPDYATGHITEVRLIAGMNSDITINALKLNACSDIRFLKPKIRKCLFQDEKPQKIPWFDNYANSHCMFLCKIYNIINVCRCIPFAGAHVVRSHFNTTIPDCTLEYLYCIQQYYVAFNTFRLQNLPTTKQPQMLDALDCSYCLPNCENALYDVRAVTQKLSNLSQTFSKFHQYSNHTANVTLVKIYFSQTANEFKRQFTRSTIGLIADVTGIFNINMGVSIISLLELIYFFCFIYIYKLLKHCHKFWRIHTNRS